MNHGTGHMVGYPVPSSSRHQIWGITHSNDIRPGDLPPPPSLTSDMETLRSTPSPCHQTWDLSTFSFVLLKICIHLCHIIRQHSFDYFSRHEVGIVATCDGIHTVAATAKNLPSFTGDLPLRCSLKWLSDRLYRPTYEGSDVPDLVNFGCFV